MLEIFLKTLSSFVDKNLSALLLGAAGMLLLMFQYWKIPEKWDKYHHKLEEIDDRLVKIETRQRRIFDFFLYSLDKSSNKRPDPPSQEFDSSEFDK